MRFRNKTIIITGGASGIGAATAELFAQEGAVVYVLDNQQLAYQMAKIIYIPCDVSDLQQVKNAIETIQKETSVIDYLFCNAGVHLFATIEESSIEAMNRVIGSNLFGTIYCLQQVLPLMKKQNFGSIVLMASDQAFIAKEQCAIYGASKAAIAQLAKSTALDYAHYNIKVNCVCPGTIDTPMYQNVIKQFQEKTQLSEQTIRANVADRLPLKRIGIPKEVAEVVSFLCSDAASFMTGALVNIDGGYTIQ